MSRLFKSHMDNGQEAGSKYIGIKKIQIEQKDEAFTADRQYIKKEQQRMITEARNEADTLIMQAKQQANTVLEDIKYQQDQWEEEKRQLAEKAYEEGFQIGLDEGKKQGYDAYNSNIEQAKQIIDQSKIEYEHYIHSSEEVILELGIATAEKIMRSTLEVEPDRFLPLVKMALKEVRDSKEIQIHVHPAQYELLLSEKRELETIFPKDVECFIYPDIDLDEFACQIESEHGRIDANISSQLVELKGKLVELLSGENHES